MAARQTLTLFVRVQILLPQPKQRNGTWCRFFVLDSIKLHKKDLNEALRKPFGEGFFKWFSLSQCCQITVRGLNKSAPVLRCILTICRLGAVFLCLKIEHMGIFPAVSDKLIVRALFHYSALFKHIYSVCVPCG